MQQDKGKRTEETRIMIYLDHAATTRLSESAFEAMLPYLREQFGNAGSVHHAGVAAKRAMRLARERIAESIGAAPGEICFTSGGTEADNMALLGAAALAGNKGHIITSAFEHHAVLNTCAYLEKLGIAVTYLPVGRDGIVCPERVREAIRPDTVLISIMAANNEIGTIQRIHEIGEVAREHQILFHTDAVQAVGHIPVNVADMRTDLLSASAHKFGGGKGSGFLYIRDGIRLPPLLLGGGQEKGRRAGTEFVPGIVAMGAALAEAVENLSERQEYVRKLRESLKKGLAGIPDMRINGAPEEERRLPNNLNVTFKGVRSETLLMTLDRYGVCVSAGSACTAGNGGTSHVLRALGLSEQEAEGTIRFSLGVDNTEAEIRETVRIVRDSVSKLRECCQTGL